MQKVWDHVGCAPSVYIQCVTTGRLGTFIEYSIGGGGLATLHGGSLSGWVSHLRLSTSRKRILLSRLSALSVNIHTWARGRLGLVPEPDLHGFASPVHLRTC